MSHLDILLPFGLPPDALATDLFRQIDTPAFAMLVARSRSTPATRRHEHTDAFSRALPHESWLARRFGLEKQRPTNDSPPIARAVMQSLGLTPRPGVWFLLNPVYFHIARDHLVLTDSRQLSLSEEESRTLFDMAQPLFQEAGRDFLYGNAHTWFVRADDWETLQTATPDAACGHNIDIWLPKGNGERSWRRLQNEVQMHWFASAFQEEREARGMKPVNSLWLWGATSSSMQGETASYTDIFNLSGWMQTFGQFVPHTLQAHSAADLIAAPPRHGLLVLDTLIEPALANDWATWLDRLHALESNWFAPLLSALKAGKIKQLSLIATHQTRLSSYITTRHSLRKFWRTPSLAPLLT